ncbi:Ulp1 protease family, C-terminal catalytic domain [Sesbania bispinosa]|nr:Ulp1 protease family, C-terminal catalytic domain [Sesbania bispinosa]
MKKWLRQLTTCMIKNNTSSFMATLVSQSPRKVVFEPATIGSSSSKQELLGKEIYKEPQSVQQGSLASKIPKWMPVSFKPPQGMSITNTKEEVAAYIFMSTEILDGKEVLVRSRFGGKLGIGNSFMGYVDLISKIFLPVNDEDLHWYLVVLDLEDEKVILLDSNPSPDRREWRLLQARKLAICFQEILMDRTFYDLRTSECPRISEFPLVEPEGLFQHPSSYNDCDVMVAKWMADSKDEKTYDWITLNSKSRMRLALDLVLDSHNNIKDEIVHMANLTLNTFIGAWANFED